jgi:hypothetical protein
MRQLTGLDASFLYLETMMPGPVSYRERLQQRLDGLRGACEIGR